MNKKYIVSIILALFSHLLFSQAAPNKYRIELTDKNNSPYSLSHPELFLSQRALDRRANQKISIDSADIPVNASYVDSVASTGAIVLNRSRWFNSLVIYTTDTSIFSSIRNFSFVKKIKKVGVYKNYKITTKQKDEPVFSLDEAKQQLLNNLNNYSKKSTSSVNTMNYGASYNQINMVTGNVLHDQGYRGEGMVIAVLDAGFWNVDVLSAFSNLWLNNRILGTRDFVEPGANVFEKSTHGMYVLSIMGAYMPGDLIGTAPNASYWLLRSEDAGSEYIVEEDNWVAAAEFADSVGADVVNSSLGYTIFDDTTQNHHYADLDGKTARASIAARIASRKGLVVVNSAGNSGDKPWQYIGVPADADSMISVGAVNSMGVYASFSSKGPSYDKRIKPDVSAQGEYTVFASTDGNVSAGNGTSFSSPIIAGLMSCLWQANPTATNMELIDAVKKSCTLYSTPDSLYGYGIPNFAIANIITSGKSIPNFDLEHSFSAFPNPFHDIIHVVYNSISSKLISVQLFDMTGKRLFNYENVPSDSGYNYISIGGISNLAKGLYLLKISSDKLSSSLQMMKLD